jgi:hypothetical protein
LALILAADNNTLQYTAAFEEDHRGSARLFQGPAIFEMSQVLFSRALTSDKQKFVEIYKKVVDK